MTKRETLNILVKLGVLGSDFSLQNKDSLHSYTAETSRFCRTIAGWFAEDGVEAVIGPAIGGIVISWCTAQHLSEITRKTVPSYFADKLGESRAFGIRRGFQDAIAGKKVLVVEDIIRTGETAKRIIEEVRRLNCEIAGLASICDCKGVAPHDVGGVMKIFTLANLETERRGDVVHISSVLPILLGF